MKTKENHQYLNTSNGGSGGDKDKQVPSLYQLLKEADLLEYHDKLKNILKLRHAGDLAYTEEKDLTDIGMSRPEQKRLRREYLKHFPQSSLVVKLRKVFGKDGNERKSDCQVSPHDDNEQHVIPADNIQLCKELGRGEFGHVYQASWSSPSGDVIQVAAKRILPEKLMSNPTSFLQEAAIMTKMRHDNVVRLFGVVLDTKSVMLISELAPCGSLLECLQKSALRDSFPVDTLCDFALQIAKGMQYLATQRLIHRDLAARNVLVFSSSKVKISDFGLSRSLGVGEDYYRSEFNPNMKLPIAWCAPECINFLRFTSASDIWSYAVTLWEMFSYGQMPWNGYSGSQILHAIDTLRQKLDCPEACPSDFYRIMVQCWSHEPERRPTFDDLVLNLPDVMPQLLVTVSECKNGHRDELQYSKNDVIILLDRCPNNFPNGEYWKGALRNGQTGLFKPSETVAYLGAENPAPVLDSKLMKSPAIAKKTEKKEKIQKLPPEKKKLLISEPQGEVLHTCHVGIDGKSFGLLQVDKNELAKAMPLINIPNGSLPGSKTSPIPSSNGSIHETVNTAPPRPAPRKIPPSLSGSSTTISSSHMNGSSMTTSMTSTQARQISSERGFKPPPPPPPSTSPPLVAPALPPKPAAKVNPTHKTMSQVENIVNPPLPRKTMSSNVEEDFRKRKELLAEFCRMGNGGDMLTMSDTTDSTLSSAEYMLDSVLRDLQKDITDISFVSQETIQAPDTKPLLSTEIKGKSNGKISPIIDTDSVVRFMSTEEGQKWDRRCNSEHRRADRKLETERKEEIKTFHKLSSTKKPDIEEDDSFDDSFHSANSIPSTSANTFTNQLVFKTPEWTPEAQEAYKLLVQCGDRLKSTSPIPESLMTRSMTLNTSTPSLPSRNSSSIVSTSSTDTETTVISVRPKHEPSAPPASNSSTMEKGDWPPPKFEDLNYVNVGGDEEKAEDEKKEKMPPQVPPKPKLRRPIEAKNLKEVSPTDEFSSGGGFAPTVSRTTLFSNYKKDEIVKF